MVVTDPNIHFFGNNFSLIANPALRPLQPPPNPALPQISPPIDIGNLLFPTQVDPLTINQLVQRAINPVDFNRMPLPDALTFIMQVLDSIKIPDQPFMGFPANVDNLGVFSTVVTFQVPISGFGSASIIEPREIPPFFVPGSTATPLPDDSDDFDNESEDLEFSGSSTEERGEDEVIVRLRVLSPSGQKLFEYEIDPKYLSNPGPLWARLSDGRYQIVIEEPGSSVPIIVRDVELRDHKIIRSFDRTRRGSDDAEARRETRPTNEVSLEFQNLRILDALDILPASEPEAETPVGEAGLDAVWENWQPKHTANGLSRPLTESEEETEDTPAVSAGVVGGLALATLGTKSLRDADSQMQGFSKRILSPAARLRRRLRK